MGVDCLYMCDEEVFIYPNYRMVIIMSLIKCIYRAFFLKKNVPLLLINNN